MTLYAHLSRENTKGFVNVQPFCAIKIFPPLLPRDDNNIILYPREMRNRQRKVDAIRAREV